MEQLNSRYGSLLGGVGGVLDMSFGSHLNASVATKLLSTHSGVVGTLEYNYVLRHKRLIFIPSVGAKFLSSDYINYYHGISGSESASSGLDDYEVNNISIDLMQAFE